MTWTNRLWIAGILIFGLSSCDGGRPALADVLATGKPAEANASKPSQAQPESSTAAPAQSKALSALFENGARSVILGAPIRHENLALFPLLASASPTEGSLRPLDEAMDKGALTVRELNEESVPTLRVKNSGDKNVFIMTGEIVTGAKQDRMSAHDVVLKAKSKEIALSVYCVEQGRWVKTSDRFSSGKITGTTSLRKMAAKKSPQGTIWSKVKEKSDEASVSSETGAMQDVYNDPTIRDRAAAFEKALGSWARDQKDMVGFAAAVDSRIVSADLFSDRTLLQALFPKLLRAVAIDAVTSKSPVMKSPAEDEVRRFLVQGFSAGRTKTENPGLGEEFLIEADNDLNGTVLIYNGEIVHLSLFGAEHKTGPRALGPARSEDSRADSSSASNETPAPDLQQSSISLSDLGINSSADGAAEPNLGSSGKTKRSNSGAGIGSDSKQSNIPTSSKQSSGNKENTSSKSKGNLSESKDMPSKKILSSPPSSVIRKVKHP